MTALLAIVGGVLAAVAVDLIRRAVAYCARVRRQRRDDAAHAAWAARHPHVVALVADVGPLAPVPSATVGDEVARAWWESTKAKPAGRAKEGE